MKVAIIGRGISALAVAFYLLKEKSDVSITFFDKNPLGHSASGNSSGLMHPYLGKKALKDMYAEKAFQESYSLLQEIQKTVQEPFYAKTPLLRFAMNQKQEEEFYLRSKEYSISLLKENTCIEIDPDIKPLPGLFIKEAITVDAKKYLMAFWGFLENKKVKYVEKKISSIEELEKEFDQVIIASGASTLSQEVISLDRIKGQMLVCENKDSIFSQPALNGRRHITFFDKYCYLGSTYERKFSEEKPDMVLAKSLLEEASLFYPKVKKWNILEVRSGIRGYIKGRKLPAIFSVKKNVWAILGMGSRGFLYHGYLGRLLTKCILHSNVQDVSNILEYFYKNLKEEKC